MNIETHGHYDDTQFDEDREQLIAEFLEKDIDKVMNVGADMQSSRNSVELAENIRMMRQSAYIRVRSVS